MRIIRGPHANVAARLCRRVSRGVCLGLPLTLIGSTPACAGGRCLAQGTETTESCASVACCDPSLVCSTVTHYSEMLDESWEMQGCEPGDADNAGSRSRLFTEP